MKKLAKVLFLLIAVATVTPCAEAASASMLNTTSISAAAGEVTLVKRLSGGGVVRKSAKYDVVDGDIYIIYGSKRYAAQRSYETGYTYCVDLGGRNNVWHFNL